MAAPINNAATIVLTFISLSHPIGDRRFKKLAGGADNAARTRDDEPTRDLPALGKVDLFRRDRRKALNERFETRIAAEWIPKGQQL